MRKTVRKREVVGEGGEESKLHPHSLSRMTK